MCLINQIPFCLLLMNCFHDAMTKNPVSYFSNHFNAQPSQRKEGIRLQKPIVSRNSLNKLHENYLSVSSLYPSNSVWLNFFLAISEYFSEIEGFDFDKALKLRPYVGIIGIDNSSVHKYLKISKVLRLHAILHDAGGLIYEIYNQRPGYSYMLPWNSSNCFSDHLSGILCCLYTTDFSSVNFSSIGMLSSRTVVLDVEGFRDRK